MALESKPLIHPELLRQQVRAFNLPERAGGCLPHPDGAVALAIYMLSIEQPQVCAAHSRYEQRYGELMRLVMELVQAEDWEALNEMFNRINPGAAKEPFFPIHEP